MHFRIPALRERVEQYVPETASICLRPRAAALRGQSHRQSRPENVQERLAAAELIADRGVGIRVGDVPVAVVHAGPHERLLAVLVEVETVSLIAVAARTLEDCELHVARAV